MTTTTNNQIHDFVQKVLVSAVRNGCSDVHFSINSKPIVRQNGELKSVGEYTLTKTDLENIIPYMLNERDQAILEADWEVDFPFDIKGISRFRVNAFKQRGSYAFSLRVIPSEIPTMEDLKLPTILRQLCHKEKGLVLVTGPTGSGKSTTLASMIQYINRNMSRRIITIEDPIEYIHTSNRSDIMQREVGHDTKEFSKALRSALRQDPDVILVGELRDLDTISNALTASETGHLVFGTLHTSDAPSTINRIVDVFPAEQQNQVRLQVSSTLQAVISQRLLKRSDKKGRVASFEILINNEGCGNLIRDGKTHQIPNIMETNRKLGMVTMQQSLQEMLNNRIIDISEAKRVGFKTNEIS